MKVFAAPIVLGLVSLACAQSQKNAETPPVASAAAKAPAPPIEFIEDDYPRALAAANMPSRAEIEDISARLARIEGALFRMEAKLAELTPGGAPADKPAPAGPTRNRKPPEGPDA